MGAVQTCAAADKRHVARRLLTLAKMLWAAPCSVVGLVLAAVPLLAGGAAKWSAGALEVTYRDRRASCPAFAHELRFRGIVFGHVILAVTREELASIGPHERVHVQQYERWGALFFLAYALSSGWQVVRGRNAYRDNYFEVQAREVSGSAAQRH